MSSLNVVGSRGHRRMPMSVLLFLLCVVAFPKAGIKVGIYPVNASAVATGFGALMLPVYFSRFKRLCNRVPAGWFAALAVYSIWLSIYSMIEWGVGPTLYRAVPVLAPIATVPWIAAKAGSGRNLVDWFLQVSWIPLIYGVAQLLLGAERIIIPGLTVNYSDWAELGTNIFASKHGATVVGVKLSSTFQNGNLYGVLLVSVFALLLVRVLRSRAGTPDWIMMFLVVVSILATYSRTTAIAASFVFIFCLLTRRGTSLIYLYVAAFLGYIVSRLPLSERLLNFDFTGAGRVPLAVGYFNDLAHLDAAQLFRLLAIGLGPGSDGTLVRQTESAPLNLIIIGGFTLLILYSVTLILPIATGPALDRRSVPGMGAAAAVVGLFVVFVLDQSLNLPPSGAILWLMYTATILAEPDRKPAERCDATAPLSAEIPR